MLQPAFEAQHFGDDIEAVRVVTIAVNELRDSDIAFGGERRQKIEALEHEADFVAAQLGARGVTHRGQIVAVDQTLSPGGLRQPANDVQQGRFAATGRSHDRNGFSRCNFEIHAAQSRHFYFARVVELPEIFRLKYRLHAP